MSSCQVCKRTEENDDPEKHFLLQHCAGCQVAVYCSRECQSLDWQAHKPFCTEAAIRQLLQAIEENDVTTVQLLATTKRVLNGTGDWPIATDSSSSNGSIQGSVTGNLRKCSPLHACIYSNNVGLLKILLQHGADTEIVDDQNETPLVVAASSVSMDASAVVELMRALLAAGADPDARTRDGWSCLMKAARDGHVEITQVLLDAGADIFAARDMFGRTAWDLVQNLRRTQAPASYNLPTTCTSSSSFHEMCQYERIHELMTEKLMSA